MKRCPDVLSSHGSLISDGKRVVYVCQPITRMACTGTYLLPRSLHLWSNSMVPSKHKEMVLVTSGWNIRAIALSRLH